MVYLVTSFAENTLTRKYPHSHLHTIASSASDLVPPAFVSPIPLLTGVHYGNTRGSLGSSAVSLPDSVAAPLDADGSSGNGTVCVAISGITTIPLTGVDAIQEIIAAYELLKVSHVYMGFNLLEGDAVMTTYKMALLPWVRSGFVSLHAFAAPFGTERGDGLKIGFLTAVLFHAKSVGYRWMIVSDADELVVFREAEVSETQTSAADAIVALLARFRHTDNGASFSELKQYSNYDLPCFIQLHGAGAAVPSNSSATHLGARYTMRAAEGGYPFGYDKSIVNVRRSFFIGLHMPGSCVRHDNDSTFRVPSHSAEYVDVPPQAAGVNHYSQLFIDRGITSERLVS